MSAARKISFRPSPLRIALWCGGAILIAALAFLHDPGPLGDRLEQAERDKILREAAQRDRVTRDSSFALPGETSRATGAVRLGVMARAAHLVALSGLEMNLYAIAAKEHGGVQPLFFDQSRALERAFQDGDLDVALVPLRTAVALRAAMGDGSPLVVAGASRGDERYVVQKDFDAAVLDGARVGVTETPVLDLRAGLASAQVVLTSENALVKKLRNNEVDAVLLPEPSAAAVAVLSSCERAAADRFGQAGPIGGAVLVVSRGLLDDEPKLAAELVQAHELSSFFVEGDRAMAVARALALMASANRKAPEEVFWLTAAAEIDYSTDLPIDALDALLDLARAQQGGIDADVTAESLVRRDLLEEARRIRDEPDDG